MKNSPSLRECTAEEYEALMPKVAHTDPLPILQSAMYGNWQIGDGNTVIYFVAEDSSEIIATGIAVKYDAPGNISFLYCPYGPVTDTWTPELLQAFRQFFRGVAKRLNITFVRLDSSGLSGVPGIRPVTNKLAVTASLQPRAEWLLDISTDKDTIWMGMHKHARYNVRLAERAHARIDFYDPAVAPLDTFIKLMETTADRDSFSLRQESYYEAVLAGTPSKHGFMPVVTIDDKPVAAAIFAEYDGVLHYIFSGSSNDFRKIAPPYFMIWQTILEAQRRGWHTLNFGGIADTVKGTHLAGVTGFKKRFGGYEVNHENPTDLVYQPLRYTAFKLYKTISG